MSLVSMEMSKQTLSKLRALNIAVTIFFCSVIRDLRVPKDEDGLEQRRKAGIRSVRLAQINQKYLLGINGDENKNVMRSHRS